jgi:hypothetical protein
MARSYAVPTSVISEDASGGPVQVGAGALLVGDDDRERVGELLAVLGYGTGRASQIA